MFHSTLSSQPSTNHSRTPDENPCTGRSGRVLIRPWGVRSGWVHSQWVRYPEACFGLVGCRSLLAGDAERSLSDHTLNRLQAGSYKGGKKERHGELVSDWCNAPGLAPGILYLSQMERDLRTRFPIDHSTNPSGLSAIGLATAEGRVPPFSLPVRRGQR